MGRPKKSQGNAREKLLEAVGRGFRAGGFGGAGVDGLAREAGLTSGAFYAHFGSKSQAFRFALVDGLEVLVRGIETFRQRHGDQWLAPFVDFYFGERMSVSLDESCALPTLTVDAARADDATREVYDQELEKLVSVIAAGLDGSDSRQRAWRLLAIFAGAAGIARAVRSSSAREELLAAAKAAAKAV